MWTYLTVEVKLIYYYNSIWIDDRRLYLIIVLFFMASVGKCVWVSERKKERERQRTETVFAYNWLHFLFGSRDCMKAEGGHNRKTARHRLNAWIPSACSLPRVGHALLKRGQQTSFVQPFYHKLMMKNHSGSWKIGKTQRKYCIFGYRDLDL